MNGRSINVNRKALSENMLKTYKPLVVLAIIGFIALPSGKALKCYQCTPTDKDNCAQIEQNMSQECSANTNPTQSPPPAGSTESSTSAGSSDASSSAGSTESSTSAGSTEPQPTTDTTEVPTTTDTTEVPTTTDSTEIPTDITPATDIPTTTAAPDIPTTTAAPAKPTTTAAPDVPTTTAAPAKPTTTAAPAKPTTTAAPEVPTTTATPDVTTITATPDSPKPPSGDGGKLRKRRSLINRFSRVQPFAEAEKQLCYTITTKKDDKVQTERGCAVGKVDEYCNGKDGCMACDSDNCNSATSNIVYTSMIMSLVIVVLFTK